MAPNLPSFILYLSRSLLIFPFQAVFPIYLVCLAIFNILRYSKGDFYIRNIVYYLSIPTQPELLDQRERDARSHNRCIRIEISYIERIESHHIYIAYLFTQVLRPQYRIILLTMLLPLLLSQPMSLLMLLVVLDILVLVVLVKGKRQELVLVIIQQVQGL